MFPRGRSSKIVLDPSYSKSPGKMRSGRRRASQSPLVYSCPAFLPRQKMLGAPLCWDLSCREPEQATVLSACSSCGLRMPSLFGQTDICQLPLELSRLPNKQAGQSQSGIASSLSSTHPHRDFSCCEVPAGQGRHDQICSPELEEGVAVDT